jgi:Xaa-Pro dipeptidase
LSSCHALLASFLFTHCPDDQRRIRRVTRGSWSLPGHDRPSGGDHSAGDERIRNIFDQNVIEEQTVASSGVPPQSEKIQEGTGPLVDRLPFDNAEYQRRLDGVRAEMAKRDIGAFITFTPENIYYLTGHDTPGYYFYQACVVTPKRPPINVLRRIETTNTLGRSWARLAVGYEDRQDPIEATLGLLHELGVAGQSIGLEEDAWFISPQRAFQLRKGIEQAGGRVVDASQTVEGLRVIKSEPELAYIRTGARALEKAMQAGFKACRVGTNENEVAAVCVAELIRHGGEYAGLPPFITTGPRMSLCHSTWAGRTLERGNAIGIELPGVIKRYCAALFRMGFIGKPDDEFTRRYTMVREVLENVIAAIKPGATSGEVHNVNKAAFARYGYGHLLSNRTAYSVGINYPPDWGEGHIMSIWDGDARPLRAGMTFHLVPGFLDLGRYAITVSDTVLVTDSACEVITNYSRDLVIIN